MTLELRPAHDPTRAYGFAASSSRSRISRRRSGSGTGSRQTANGSTGKWAIKKVIEIPAEPADPEKLPPILQGFKAVAPLVTDINLSLDDRYLYVSCWGTGEFIQYDVSDPFKPKKISSIRLGGIVSRTPHPSRPEQPLNGGPQMVEISRDGKRIYFTNASTRRGTSSSIQMASGDGWRRSTCAPEEAWSWTRGSSWSRTACARIRFDWKAATRRPIGTATREREGLVMEWEAMLVLGAYHGINPGMGWLFAVAWACSRGAREACGARCRRSRSVTRWRWGWSCLPRRSPASWSRSRC